jgi:hypothetical protein
VRIGLRVLPENCTREVTLLECLGRYMRLESPSRLVPDTSIQWELEGQTVVGQVIVCVPRGGQFDVWLEAQQPAAQECRPHSTWRLGNSPESVLDGLLKLNERLLALSDSRGRGCNHGTPDSRNLGILPL